MDQSGISKKPNLFNDKPGVDCKFLVGAKDTEEISGHKAIFANASPVFCNMFFGSVAEKGDEIKIPDIQPEAFRTMVDFFYTGEVKFTSAEHAVQVWYAAHKYDLGKLTQPIISYLKNKVTPKNVCYILEFAISFENETVMTYCREVILEHISTILNDPSFLEADLSVLNFILDQNELEVSEVDLFKGLLRYFNAQKNILEANSVQSSSTSSSNTESDDLNEKEVGVPDGNSVNSVGEGSSNKEGTDPQVDIKTNNYSNPLKELVKKIRFLTMKIEEFQQCFAISSLLSDSEAVNIMYNISFPLNHTHPMPKGFSNIKNKRKHQNNVLKTYPYLQTMPQGPVTQKIVNVTPINLPRCIELSNQNYAKYYGNHTVGKSDSYLNVASIEGFLYFETNIHILITGVQVINPPRRSSNTNTICKIQIRNERNVTFSSKQVDLKYESDSFVEIPFECPVYIDAKSSFIIGVSFQNVDAFYPYKCLSSCKVNNVIFEFKRSNQVDCECRGLIRSIIFTNVEDTDCNNE